jgi:hypothetical protein
MWVVCAASVVVIVVVGGKLRSRCGRCAAVAALRSLRCDLVVRRWVFLGLNAQSRQIASDVW